MNEIIQKGDSSITVLKIQQLLNQLKITDLIIEDGYYGDDTEHAILCFQSKLGLEITGMIDALTWDKLILKIKMLKKQEVVKSVPLNPLQYGSKGLDVYKAQEYLNLLLPEYPTDIHGIYDAKTQVNVIRFQNKMGLNPDGKINLETWNQMIDAL